MEDRLEVVDISPSMLKTFINRPVVIVLNNGFRKFGEITDMDNTFVNVFFRKTGEFELIAKSDIKCVKFDRGNGRLNDK